MPRRTYRGRNGRNDVMFKPRGFTPTAAITMSVPTSRAGPMARLPLLLRPPPKEAGAELANARRVGRRCAVALARGPETSALPSESPWPTTGLTCLIRPVRCG